MLPLASEIAVRTAVVGVIVTLLVAVVAYVVMQAIAPRFTQPVVALIVVVGLLLTLAASI